LTGAALDGAVFFAAGTLGAAAAALPLPDAGAAFAGTAGFFASGFFAAFAGAALAGAAFDATALEAGFDDVAFVAGFGGAGFFDVPVLAGTDFAFAVTDSFFLVGIS
jgi:hypothetical protein